MDEAPVLAARYVASVQGAVAWARTGATTSAVSARTLRPVRPSRPRRAVHAWTAIACTPACATAPTMARAASAMRA
jgi:hypothetical protein